MPQSHSSSAQRARRELAYRLRELAEDAGLDGKDLAALCGWHPSKVSRISTAKTQPSAEDIRAWCRACGVEDQAADLVASLRAVEGTWLTWRRLERAGLRRSQEERLPLYLRTTRFRAYSSWALPGLLQTCQYTEDVLRNIQQQRVPLDDVPNAVAARMERRHVLREGQRRFAFLIEEPVLRNTLSTGEAQKEQLEHLLAVSGLPNLSLGVIPVAQQRRQLPTENFWIYDSAQVNVELVSGYLTLTQPSEVRAYADTFATLAGMAVYGERARGLIMSAMERLR
ncbi:MULTISPECIES: helix-turn-helix domain-containing protein [Streptomyces]|uniref:Transcriptional regulator n=1 Tax=Streptomyces cacaoi TaxID=1898 RepID=A0A4Y3RC67_STRCI|nr:MULTISPECIES: helix-turn-helix transcriptional regulator [Streptomyces]NNG88673.1 helix-turn-helix domain-containing protein [Streptomyces cacaoi]QHF97345.1 XRE family transcriptional regulator [Streptomyces sp. NHF165]GEB54263.1 transcriptional regulator [Streptomyces cacaoi]